MSPAAKLMLNLFLPFFAVHCMEQMYFVYGTVLQSYALSPKVIGWILSSYFITIMSIRPLGGWIMENFGIRKTLIGAGVLGFVGCTVLFFARGVPMLLLGRILSGASFGVYGVGIFSYQAIAIPARVRGSSFALITSGGVLPMAIATPLGEWFLLHGHPNAYLAMGPLFAIACVYFGSRVGDQSVSSKKKESWGTYSELLAFRPYVMLLLSGMLMALVDASVISISLLSAEHGIAASYFLTSIAVVAAIVRILGSNILGMLPRMLFFSPAALCMACGLFAASAFPSDTVFLLAGALFGLGIGMGWPVYLALIADILPSALRPKGTATALLLYDSGWIATPLIVGYAASVLGNAWTFRLLSLAALLAVVALYAVYWIPLHRRTTRQPEYDGV